MRGIGYMFTGWTMILIAAKINLLFEKFQLQCLVSVRHKLEKVREPRRSPARHQFAVKKVVNSSFLMLA